MNRTATLSAVALAASLAFSAGSVFAQHPEEQGEHGAPSQVEAPGHGDPDPGFHHPPAMRWLPGGGVGHAQSAGEHAAPPPTPFIGPLINFAILLVLGYMALRRSINPSLQARRASMETEIAEATRLRTEAEAMHREYTERLGRLGDEIERMKRDFTEAGQAERDRIVADAQTKAERMREDGVRAVAQEMAMVREELRRETVLAAAATAEETVRRAINTQDQQRLADEFLGGLEAAVKQRGEGAQA